MLIIPNLTYFLFLIKSQLVSCLIFGFLFFAFLAHAAIFANGLPQMEIEGHYLNRLWYLNFYGWLSALFSPREAGVNFVARYFSIFCALGSICSISFIAMAWSKDRVSASLILLGFVIFPPVAYVSALATPHSFLMLLSTLILLLISRENERVREKVLVIIALICALMVVLDPTGLVLAFIMALFTMCRVWGHQRLIFNKVSILYVCVLSIIVGLEVGSSLIQGRALVLENSATHSLLFKPYLMLWVSLSMSAVILFPRYGLYRHFKPFIIFQYKILFLNFILAVPAILVWAHYSGAPIMLMFYPFLSLGVLSALPVILWCRFVMPNISSFWVWLCLPVLMYLCFWLILWPINFKSFPYDLLV
jgi:hypothetical protein